MRVPEAADPRLVMTRMERRAQAIARTATGSPLWVLFAALLCSELTGIFGNAGLLSAIAAVSLIGSISLLSEIILHGFKSEIRLDSNPETVQSWLGRALQLDILMSAAWGLVPWMLWAPGNPANHVFLEMICLAVGARFLVSRAAHLGFFLASFGPMAGLLFLRLVMEGTLVDLVLAAVIPLYAAHVALDARLHSTKSYSEVQHRLAMEDMAGELERARDEALRGRAEAETANASKTAFLANMSHELRTPLNAILGFSEIIARECLGPVGSARYKEYAGDIHNSGSHLLSLINDLLDIAKIESGKMELEPEMIETRRVLDAALNFIAVKARERGQTLTVGVAQDAEEVFADERAVKQIVINLVSNAVKFSPEGGRIEVDVRRDAANGFELRVADDGPGIPRDKLDQIFQPFAQIDNRYDRKATGTGLGLALVRGLAELHGGRAWIESNGAEGTRVYVLFPQVENKIRRLETA